MSIEQSYIDIYKEYAPVIKKSSTKVLNKNRDAAFASFEKMGFPASGLEDYNYTDLRSRFATDFGLNLNRLFIPVNPYDVFKCDVPDINSHLYFVVNDLFYPLRDKENKELQKLIEKGVLIGSLANFSASHPQLVAAYYGQSANYEQDALTAFNTAFAQDGFFLYVPKNVIIEKPIQLINVMRADKPLLANARNLIILEEGARASVVVCSHAMDAIPFLCNRVTEVFVGERAVYEHYKMESTHNEMTNIGSLFVEQAASSQTLINEMTLMNGLTRNNIRINLDGEHCETLLCGIAIGDKKEHIDNHTLIRHSKPNCTSKELYKYVLDGDAVGGFSGKILVHPHAQKTVASQSNRNICLSPNARMFSKPQLEIYADDVKCSHGATTGQIDDNALFYMRTRGIPEKEARMLLMLAFANDVIENIRIDALQSRIRTLVENRFRGELSKCAGCIICKE
jgi:Fe-S cluster assembly protein SufD